MTTAGEQLRLDGLADVCPDLTVDVKCEQEVAATFSLLVQSGHAFHAETLRNAVSPDAKGWMERNPPKIGSFFATASRNGQIKRAEGDAVPKRKQRHGNPNALWKGTRA
ncbi:hypothetical protein EU244_012695 [Rhodococcus qingshengii]|uniref:hypothetical protein n=1 Tax=Rhodococcus qingshengii TaxID=334542 RepID=UPI0010A5C74D|nr:hypothetical protein [Rhodococcus qingshengii]THJ69959.1 hypothetical protein EU244_20080 [Rhodococcus qingshengii]